MNRSQWFFGSVWQRDLWLNTQGHAKLILCLNACIQEILVHLSMLVYILVFPFQKLKISCTQMFSYFFIWLAVLQKQQRHCYAKEEWMLAFFKTLYSCSGIHDFICRHFLLYGRCDFSWMLRVWNQIWWLQNIVKSKLNLLKSFFMGSLNQYSTK